MTCLSQEQLVHLALGRDGDSDVADHVAGCADCREALAALRNLTEQLSEVHQAFNDVHADSRRRLLAELQKESPQRTAANEGKSLSSQSGGRKMKRRMIMGGALAAVLATLILFELLPAPEDRVSAMDRMADQISKATSYRMKCSVRIQYPTADDGPPFAFITIAFRSCWKAPRTLRADIVQRDYQNWEDVFEPEPGDEETQIYVTDRPGISINHTAKTYYVMPARSGSGGGQAEHELIQNLGRFRQKADRQLGSKTIDGKTLVGFEIDAKKVDPDYFPGTVVVWLDEATNLPSEIYEYYPEALPPRTLQMTNIEWNVELDDSIFDATPPDGYEDKTSEPPSVKLQIERMTTALRLYAELSGGHYPRVRKIHSDYLLDRMQKMAGLQYPLSAEQQQDEQVTQLIQRIYTEVVGISALQEILNNNPDSAWNGLTVGPQDADKILIRWKRPEGGYQVIYGDLHSETVSAERLRELESQ